MNLHCKNQSAVFWITTFTVSTWYYVWSIMMTLTKIYCLATWEVIISNIVINCPCNGVENVCNITSVLIIQPPAVACLHNMTYWPCAKRDPACCIMQLYPVCDRVLQSKLYSSISSIQQDSTYVRWVVGCPEKLTKVAW